MGSATNGIADPRRERADRTARHRRCASRARVSDGETADAVGRTLIVPASVYSEALVAFARARRLGDARASVAAMGIEIAPLTAGVAERAAEVRAGHRHLRLPDAMVVACAREIGGELLTYDDRLAYVGRGRPRQ